MDLTISNEIILSGMQPETRQAIRGRLTMPNPKHREAERMGRYTANIPEYLKFYTETASGLICPRGAAGQIFKICQNHREDISVIDQRRTLPPVDFDFQGTLRPYQIPAVKGSLNHSFGLLEAPTGSGKTAMALYMIAERRQPVLICVHTRELLNQWMDRINQFLGIPWDEIGIIGNGKFRIGDRITVAMVQTLYKRAAEVSPHVGYIILDECHKAPAMQYIQAVEQFDCKYMSGLTATPWRRDGLTNVIHWHIGDVIGKIQKAELVENGNLCKGVVRWVKTDFETNIDASEQYSRALASLVDDEDRNKLIARTVAENNGTGISLILSDRKAHCWTLADILSDRHGIEAAVLTGSTSNPERQKILESLKAGKCRYLIATGQLVGEGFDLPAISSMFLTTPIKFSGRVIQYIGRALRPAPGKEKAYIFDFVDHLNPVFRASAKKRFYTYQHEGIKNEG